MASLKKVFQKEGILHTIELKNLPLPISWIVFAWILAPWINPLKNGALNSVTRKIHAKPRKPTKLAKRTPSCFWGYLVKKPLTLWYSKLKGSNPNENNSHS